MTNSAIPPSIGIPGGGLNAGGGGVCENPKATISKSTMVHAAFSFLILLVFIYRVNFVKKNETTKNMGKFLKFILTLFNYK